MARVTVSGGKEEASRYNATRVHDIFMLSMPAMWKLKIAEGADNPWLKSLNNHVGRQVWEFDPNAGSPEELADVEKAREGFRKLRFDKKHSSDLLMRMQVQKRRKENVADFVEVGWLKVRNVNSTSLVPMRETGDDVCIVYKAK
ncbi:hypothetical protein ACLOJK_003578 [Asimina triloba]